MDQLLLVSVLERLANLAQQAETQVDVKALRVLEQEVVASRRAPGECSNTKAGPNSCSWYATARRMPGCWMPSSTWNSRWAARASIWCQS